jgi:hypothetical protein
MSSCTEIETMKLLQRWLTAAILVSTVCGLGAAQETSPAESTYTADWQSLSKHKEAPEWFRDDKFGIYFHWGVYSVRSSARRQGTFQVQVNGASVTGQSAVTSDWDAFETTEIGTIGIDRSGPQAVTIVPVEKDWAAMNLAFIEFQLVE